VRAYNIYIYIYVCVCVCVCTKFPCGYLFLYVYACVSFLRISYASMDMYVCMRVYTYVIHNTLQATLAFMMGTHTRLGASSPLSQLDPCIAAFIARL
jgi:hypothetical protein